MAIFHLSVKPISRSAGRSSTAAAAYRAGDRVVDERTGEIHDYTRKGGVLESDIVLPAGSDWMPTRSELWSAAELAEKRKDACVAREHEIALPAELTAEQRSTLVRTYAKDLAQRHRCAVDFAIHEPNKEGDERNFHAHVLCSTRKVEGRGFGAKCDREKAGRDRKADLTREREAWEFYGNYALSRAGIAERIDHRSLKDRGIDREPGQHLGPAAINYERRTGEKSNRRIDLEREVIQRLARAKEAGELERKVVQVEQSIIDTKSELAAALAERKALARSRPRLKERELFSAQQQESQKEERSIEAFICERQATTDALVLQGGKPKQWRLPRPGEKLVGVVESTQSFDCLQYIVIDAGPNRDRTAQQMVVVQDSLPIRIGKRYKAREANGSMERDRSMDSDRGRGIER